jgi:NADPH2:quinone reductase
MPRIDLHQMLPQLCIHERRRHDAQIQNPANWQSHPTSPQTAADFDRAWAQSYWAHLRNSRHARTGVVVLLTGAGSAVGRLLGKLLTDRGVKVIRLVRSEASAEKLAGILPGSPILATDVAGWKDSARAAAEGAKIHITIDSVGGRLLGDIAERLAEGTGTVINFGSLGGETSDIRLFPPRSLTLKGVFLGHWTQQPPEQRKADIALAQRLAHEPGPLFEVAERYPPSRISNAVAHVSQAGRAGVVLFDFTRD